MKEYPDKELTPEQIDTLRREIEKVKNRCTECDKLRHEVEELKQQKLNANSERVLMVTLIVNKVDELERKLSDVLGCLEDIKHWGAISNDARNYAIYEHAVNKAIDNAIGIAKNNKTGG